MSDQTAEQNYLINTETYLKTGIHIGTTYKTKAMKPYIHKIRPEGLAVLNLTKIDERIKVGAKLLSQFDPKDIIAVCRRESGWKGLNLFAKATGINIIAGRYPPGLLTNTDLKNYKEAKLIFASDAWLDKNIIHDAHKNGILIMGLVDSNNTHNKMDYVIPCNNKGRKSLGLVYFLLARQYMLERKMISKEEEFPYTLEDFIELWNF